MLSLSIQHNIHLTRQQRYDLHEGKDIEVVGYSVPVWVAEKITSEPGKEIFCHYMLKNPRKELPIKILDNGYEVTIPYREGTQLEISNDEWRRLNQHEPEKLQELYKQLIPEVSSIRLLDISDGGNGGSMIYREHNKVNHNEDILNIIHYVSIEPIESLITSLTLQ